MSRPALFLIDGSSQMYRAYHAFRGQGLSDQEGHSTHAVYVFVTMLRKLIAEHRPEYIAASFDLAGPTFRDEIAGDYKATRAAMPDDLKEQIAWVHEACEALGVPIVTLEGYEADDVIGTLARRGAAAGFDVAIVSIDKDFMQLVGDGIRIYDPREDGAWFDAEAVREKAGVRPSQVADWLALVGDTSDNVAGVPGIGKKGAADLLGTFGSIDALLDRTDELKPKQREALVSHRESLLTSRRLVTIHTDVPVTVDFESLRYRGASRERCYDLFSRLAFRSLVTEYAPTAENVSRDYALVTTLDALDALVADIRAAGHMALRVVVDGDTPLRSTIVGLAVAVAPRRARYIPMAAEAPGPQDLLAEPLPHLTTAAALERLSPVLLDPAIRKVGHDLKTDALVLAAHGVRLDGLAFDSMLASYLLDATRPSHALEDVAIEHLGYRALTREDVCGKGAKGVPLGTLAPETVLTYAGERADLAGQVEAPMEALLTSQQLSDVYRSLEMPLVPVLVDIERVGVRLDTAALAVQSRTMDEQLTALTSQIYALAGEPFNINSPKQLGEVLFERLKLPAGKKTGKTKSVSTAADVLEELALTHELPRLVLDFRALHKLKSTYVDALPLLVHPATGRLHTSFNQAVAATGRLSSSDPNLQNIPIRTPLGREIRRAFVADPGHVLISADYSQIELRVLAHMAGEPALIDAFRNGEDIHDRTAAQLFGADSGLSRHELRSRSKMVNYAVLYGKTPFTLARDINVTQEAAQAFIDAYFSGFPRVRAFIDRLLDEARTTGVVRTMYGRRRLVPNVVSRNFQMRAQAEREAINMPIQGTAADILKRAMIDLHTRLIQRGSGTRMILTVHDELLFESPKGEVDEAVRVVRERMEGAATLAVPLTVDVGIGENWKDAKP
jgi:DNA polymerase-1